MNKVAIYVRVSTLEQSTSGYSVKEQTDKLKAYAMLRDWTIHDIYTDSGYSGAKLERPDLTRLIQDIKTGGIDAVLVYKLDRLSRSQKHTIHLVEDIFNKNKVEFISLSENLDTTTPFGKAMIGILAVFAQLEREQIKERMQMGRIGRAKSGKAMAWEDRLFGYSYDKANDTLVLDEYEAEVVRMIYNEYLSGTSITKLVKILNKGGYGKDNWRYNTVRRILSNPIYCGYNQYLGETYKGNHVAILSKETHQRTLRELEIRREKVEKEKNSRPFQSKYLLSGLMRCKKCGALMTSKVSKSYSNTVHYQCKHRAPVRSAPTEEKYCLSGFYAKDDLEKLVMRELRKLQLNKDEIINNLPNKANNDEVINKRIAIIENKIKKLSDLYINDLLTLDELQIKTGALNKEKNTLIKEFNSDNQPNPAVEYLSSTDINVDNLNYEQVKYVCNLLIDHIDVDEDLFEIYWKF